MASLLILAYNEENTIEEVIEKYFDHFENIILIDDFRDYDISEYDYVINATSLGLKDNQDLIFDVKKTKYDCTVIDIVMDPEETILIKEAIKHRRNYHLGKNMLTSQIKLAGNFFHLW